MNGYNLLCDAARLIGLEGADENLKIIGLPLVNSVINELGYAEISSLSEKIGISSQGVCSALRFGVAALIAGATGDEQSRDFALQKYHKLKTSLTSHIEKVRDVLPKGDF